MSLVKLRQQKTAAPVFPTPAEFSWCPACRRALRRPPETGDPEAPDETPHCPLRFVCILRACGPRSSREIRGPTMCAKSPKSAAANSCLRLFVAKQKEDVEIRIGEQQPPSVTAECQQAEPLRSARCGRAELLRKSAGRCVSASSQSARSVSRALAPASNCCRMRCRSSSACGPSTDKGVREPCMVFSGSVMPGSRPGRAAVVTSI